MKYGPRQTKPAVKPATNSGIFSNSGAGQKKDPVTMKPGDKAAFNAAHRRHIKPVTGTH